VIRVRQRAGSSRVTGLIFLAVAAAAALAWVTAGSGASGDVGWGGFGNTPNQNRHTSLSLITKSNVDQLGRVFTVDFRAIDPGARRGQQSFPIVSGDRMYLTTNEDQVWALDATSGKVLWRWKPDNVAVFNKFGIVANRGLALCDGHLFMLTLDMTIVMLDPSDGSLIKHVPISRAVPGATPAYGYSETSAPMCGNHRLVVGAAGSEYGVRGFVMAYNTADLSPAWANPFWTIPPEGTSWRKLSRIVGGGVVWTPTTIDTATNTLYFGTGSATPLYYPPLRPGSNPRADSLISVNLRTGKMNWWQQQMAHNEWSYDTAQPPLVYTGRVGGKTRKVVSVATMEGVWFCYDAKTGRPIYQRVKVIDRTEHPKLQPGKPVVVYPSSLGGVNYSPASYDPKTNLVFNGASETAAIDIQVRLSPTEKKRKRLEGDVFLGLLNGDFGSYLPGWHDYGSVSAINVNTGRRVWKTKTPEPERGGVATTASGLAFAGGGDGVLRAFDQSDGKILWHFQTGHQIAAGASIYSVNGKEYVAVTAGGTPTSSNGGGCCSELHVFALGGSQKESPPPTDLPKSQLGTGAPVVQTAPAPNLAPARAAAPKRVKATHRVSAVSALGAAKITTQPPVAVRPWLANSSNVQNMFGRVRIGASPVVGATLRVDGYSLPVASGPRGGFLYPADISIARRHVVKVVGVGNAKVKGRALTAGEKAALLGTEAGFNTGYRVDRLHVTRQEGGGALVTGRVSDTFGNRPLSISLYTYQLTGTITDVDGKPVQGAVVVARTNDRDFWTFSSPSDASGHYTSFFHASDETSADPVPLSIGVALGAISYGGNLGTPANFARNKSARLDIKLGRGTTYTLGKPESYVGAIYEGLVVGVTGPHGVVKPIAERWPDAKGNFSMLLPASTRGQTLRFWENQRQFFSAFAQVPGGKVELRSWPTQLGDSASRGISKLVVPR
jgi:alcohol dehydrogenase (cytochrome c)